MKLTWEDFEAHRGAATPGQWRRMEAYFREGKTIAEIAADEGTRGKHYNAFFLAIGRGCMAVIKSMLQQPVRVPTEKKELVSELQELLRRAAETTASSGSQAEGAIAVDIKRDDTGDELALAYPEDGAVLQDGHPPLGPSSECASITLGMRVQGSNGADRDAGRVLNIEGDTALVAWDSGFQAPTPVANLTPLAP